MDTRQTCCIEALRSSISSVASGWSSGVAGGWREFPDSSYANASSVFDIWSTSQAIEILCLGLRNFSKLDSDLGCDVEETVKEWLINSVESLVISISNDLERKTRLLAPGEKPDVIGLVWQLRAVSQLLNIIREFHLSVNTDSLFHTGEILLRDLFVLQAPNGAWSSFGDAGKSSYVTAMAIWAIAEASDNLSNVTYFRAHKVHGTHVAVEWLLNNRLPNSGIPFFEHGITPSISRTSLTTIAAWARRQMRCIEGVPEVEFITNNAWIIQQQTSSGGWHDNFEEGEIPDTEVTALAVLALLKGGTLSIHPALCRAVDWMLSAFQRHMSICGWGMYQESCEIRIWTTWYANLALWEFLLKSIEGAVAPLCLEIYRTTRYFFLPQGTTRSFNLQLRTSGPGVSWGFIRTETPEVGVELTGLQVIRFKEGVQKIKVEVYQSKSGVQRCIFSVHDLVTGRIIEFPIRVIAPDTTYKYLLSSIANPKVVVTGVAASSATFAFLKFGSQITVDFCIDLICILLGSFLVMLFFAYFSYKSDQS